MDGECSTFLTKKVLESNPFVTKVTIVMLILRLLLALASMKFERVSRSFFFVESVQQVLTSLRPWSVAQETTILQWTWAS